MASLISYLKKAKREVVDVFDANTEEDQRKRIAAGQARMYADQQRANGIARPMTNLGQQIVGNTARFGNTVKAGAGLGYGFGLIGKESLTGTDKSYQRVLDQVQKTVNRDLSPTGGVLGAGTMFKNAREAANISAPQLAKRTLVTGLGVAGEALPVGKGISIAKTPTVKNLAKVGGQGAVASAAADAGQQEIETGRIDPMRTATSAVIGAGGAVLPGLTVRGAKAVAPTARKGVEAAKPAVQKTAETAKAAKYNYDKYDPKVRELDRQYTELNTRWQKATPQGRKQLDKAILANRQARKDVTRLGPGLGIREVRSTNPGNTQPNDLPNPAPSPNGAGTNPIVRTSASLPSSVAPAQTLPAAPPIVPPITRTQVSAEPQLPAPRTQSQPAVNTGENLIANPPSTVAVPKQGKHTRYASKTVPASEFVSEQVRKDVKAGAPVYDVQTEKARYTDSLSRLKNERDDAFEVSVRDRLAAPDGKVTSQDIADAQTLAAILDARKDPSSLQKATEIYERLSSHLTAAGQTVQAAAILSRRTPEGLRYWATRQLQQAGVKQSPEFTQRLNKLITEYKTAPNKQRSAHNITKLVNDNIPTHMADKIINAWRAGLLTAPSTTGGNLLGNTGETLVRKAFVNPVATVADAAMSLATGRRTQTLAAPGASGAGFNKGVKTLPDYIKTGYDPRNLGTKYEQPRDLNYGNGPLGKAMGAYVNGTYRLMGLADAPFSYAAQNEALSSIAKAEGLNRGLGGSQLDTFVDDFMANPPEAAINRAAQEADFATFKNQTPLGTMISGAKQTLERKGMHKSKAVVDFFVPFTQVPSAIATRLIQRTPVGIAYEIATQIKNVKAGQPFDQRAMSQAIGNGTFGVAAIGAGKALAETGDLTFGYPTDQTERALWEAEGKQPYSVKLGNRWYSLNYLQPFGMLLAIGGQAQNDIAEGKNETEVITNAIATAGQAIQEQSFLKGINGVLTAISDPERSAQKWMENTTSSVVPNLIRSGARAADEVQRKPSTIVEGVKSGIPGLRGQTPEKIGIDGKPVPAKDNFVNQWVNPFKPSIARSNPTIEELRRLQQTDNGVMPSKIQKDSLGEGTEINGSQIRELQASVNKGVVDSWKQLQKTAQYKNMSDEDKAAALKSLSKDVMQAEKIKYASSNSLGKFAADYQGERKAPTGRVQKILSGDLDISSYANPGTSGTSYSLKNVDTSKLTPFAQGVIKKQANMSSEDREKFWYEKPDAEYNYEAAKFEADKKMNRLTKKEAFETEIKLRNMNLKKGVSKEARDVYSMGDDKIEAYLAINGTDKLVDELLALDDIEVNNGLRKSHKLGGTYGSKKRKGRGGKKWSSADINSALSASTSVNKIRTSAPPSSNVQAPTYQKAPLKKYSVRKVGVSKKA